MSNYGEYSLSIICCDNNYNCNFELKKLVNILSYKFRIIATTIIVEKNEKNYDNFIEEHASFKPLILETVSKNKRQKIIEACFLFDSDFICVFDPDIKFCEDGLREFVKLISIERIEDIIYARISNKCNGKFISKLISIDKLWSHLFIRPTLATLKVSVTIPGQFYITKRKYLIENRVKASYLDDLELGLHLRINHATFGCKPIFVGKEETRSNTYSLIMQRTRWMKGIFSLLASSKDYYGIKGIILVLVHLMSYHVVPIILFILFFYSLISKNILLTIPIAIWVLILKLITKANLIYTISYAVAFPVIHILAFLLFPIKVPVRHLRMR